jgi:hypothetical protein
MFAPLSSSPHPLMNLLLVVICFASCVLYVLIRSSRRKIPYPPGPKPDPIIGNIRHMKKYDPWVWYTELKKQYGKLDRCAHFFGHSCESVLPDLGDIVHLSALGQHIIILNSFEAVQDIVVRKAAAFSDRPRFVMCGEL